MDDSGADGHSVWRCIHTKIEADPEDSAEHNQMILSISIPWSALQRLLPLGVRGLPIVLEERVKNLISGRFCFLTQPLVRLALHPTELQFSQLLKWWILLEHLSGWQWFILWHSPLSVWRHFHRHQHRQNWHLFLLCHIHQWFPFVEVCLSQKLHFALPDLIALSSIPFNITDQVILESL